MHRASPSHRVDHIGMNRLTQLANNLRRKMEKNAADEAVRMRESSNGKLRIIGTAIGILVVIMVALWMEYHP